MLNHGVTQMYLTRNTSRSRIFTGRASISTRSKIGGDDLQQGHAAENLAREIRCEFITR